MVGRLANTDMFTGIDVSGGFGDLIVHLVPCRELIYIKVKVIYNCFLKGREGTFCNLN